MKAVLNVHFMEGFRLVFLSFLMIIKAGFPIRLISIVSSPKCIVQWKKSETNRKLNALIDQYDFS